MQVAQLAHNNRISHTPSLPRHTVIVMAQVRYAIAVAAVAAEWCSVGMHRRKIKRQLELSASKEYIVIQIVALFVACFLILLRYFIFNATCSVVRCKYIVHCVHVRHGCNRIVDRTAATGRQ